MGILLLELIYWVVSLVILISYFCNICHEDRCSVHKCLHSILKRTKIVECGPKNRSVFYDFQIEENDYSMIYSLVCYLLWLLLGAAIVFLDVFLIEVTNSCDPSASRANCFLNIRFFNISALYDEPIDCNNLNNLPNNVTFICYRYTLNLGAAFGTAGGFFATGMMFMNLIASCYGKGKPSDCFNIVGHIHMVVGVMFSLIVLVAVSAVPTLQQILIEGSFIVFYKFLHILRSLQIVHLFIRIMLCKRNKTNMN